MSDCVPIVLCVVSVTTTLTTTSSDSGARTARPCDGDVAAAARARARCTERGVNPSCRSKAPGVNSTGMRLASSSIDHRMLMPPSGPIAGLHVCFYVSVRVGADAVVGTCIVEETKLTQRRSRAIEVVEASVQSHSTSYYERNQRVGWRENVPVLARNWGRWMACFTRKNEKLGVI